MWPVVAIRESRKVSLLSWAHGYPDQNSVEGRREKWIRVRREKWICVSNEQCLAQK